MPFSEYNHMYMIMRMIRRLQPTSVLDIGVGFGKWGHLFREALEIVYCASEPQRYEKKNWRVTIDGIEGFAPYLTPMHEYLYNRIHVGNMLDVLPTLGQYDVVFAGDVIEHVEKQAGLRLVAEMHKRSRLATIISTPAEYIDQHDVYGNPLEDHQSVWKASDFAEYPDRVVRVVDGTTLVVVLSKPGAPRHRLPSMTRSVAMHVAAKTVGLQRMRRWMSSLRIE